MLLQSFANKIGIRNDIPGPYYDCLFPVSCSSHVRFANFEKQP